MTTDTLTPKPRGVTDILERELQRAYDALIAIDYPDPVARDHALRTLGLAAKRWMESGKESR